MFSRFFLCLLVSMLVSICTSCNDINTEKKHVTQIVTDKNTIDSAQIEFDNVVLDFGTIDRSKYSEIYVEFCFTNVGQSPLVIYKADVTCSCISTEFPKQAFLAGQQGKISVKVNTKGQDGFFSKTLVVKSNASNSYVLLRVNGNIN